MNYIVITSIHGLTDAVEELSKKEDWHIVVVGDKKSKPIISTDRLTYLSIEDQYELGYPMTELIPYNHYSRKNIGYMYAIKNGAEIIYETDDDNYPSKMWDVPSISGNEMVKASGFVNICHLYTKQRPIWPRGFPLV
jgi:hypothetical protein